jgi:hypothetical protein
MIRVWRRGINWQLPISRTLPSPSGNYREAVVNHIMIYLVMATFLGLILTAMLIPFAFALA